MSTYRRLYATSASGRSATIESDREPLIGDSRRSTHCSRSGLYKAAGYRIDLPATAASSASAVNTSEALDYLITSSARCSNAGGIVNPSALAVFRLMTSSNFVGCSTGRSVGLAPLKILST